MPLCNTYPLRLPTAGYDAKRYVCSRYEPGHDERPGGSLPKPGHAYGTEEDRTVSRRHARAGEETVYWGKLRKVGEVGRDVVGDG